MSRGKMEPYWASVEPKEIADRMLDKIEDYYEYLQASGRLDLLRRSWMYYYRPRLVGGTLNAVGEQGELTAMAVNFYRNLLLHLETLTVQQRPSFEPRATNSDQKSQSQVILASGLLEYYMREKKLERYLKQAVKDSLIFGEGFLRLEWDATSGKKYGFTPMNTPQYEGDIKYTNYDPLNVIRDFTKTTPHATDWVILRDFVNKHDLAAKFPELADQILDDSDDALELARTTTLNFLSLEDSDNVAVYTLLHKPSPAMPQGRFTTMLHNRTVMLDGPIPYDETHVYRMAPDEETGTIFGYTTAFDLLPVQEALDLLHSTAISNNATFGVQNILVPTGHNLSVSQMSGGLNVVECDMQNGKPEALQLTATAPETYNYMEMLKGVQQMLAGLDSVTMGNPEASLKSGAALALVQSTSIQFSMNLVQSFTELVESTGDGTINLLKSFAAVPRVAAIAGKSNRPLMKEFTGDELGLIDRVTVNSGNPLMNTVGGKTNLAEWYLQNGFIENPDQINQVIQTGRMEPIIEGKQANLLLIKGENEGLAEGIPQRALVTDNHPKHILEHTIVLANPDIRQDPNNPIVALTLAHIQEHMNMMNDPNAQQLLAILHQENVQMPQPGQVSAGQQMTPGAPVMAEAQDVNMPNAPANAAPQVADMIEQQAV